MAALERCDESRLIDHRAAGHVDEVRTGLHQSESARIHEMPRLLRQWAAQHQVIAAGEEIVEFEKLDSQPGSNLGSLRCHICSSDGHPEPEAAPRDRLTN